VQKSNAKTAKVALGAVAAVALTVSVAAVGNSAAGAQIPAAAEYTFEVQAPDEIVLEAAAQIGEEEAIFASLETDEVLEAEISTSHDISVHAVIHRPDTGARQISAYGLDLIKFFEGYSATGYLLGDGVCTIGWGHTVPENSLNCEEWEITEEQATEYLLEHLVKFEAAVDSYFTRDLTQHQFDALVSFSYNVGEAYRKYDWPTSPDDEYFARTMMLYVKPAQFTEGLTIRRTAEVELFNAPEDEQPIPQIIEVLAAQRLEREQRLAAEAAAA
jgi:GH24 family phage-related lysozyme (muramidase)